MPLIDSEALPVLLKVTDNGLLVAPTVVEEKVRDDGDRLTKGAGTAAPVPVRATFWGLDEELSAILSVPVRVPEAVGLKETLMTQFAPAPTELPQVFV